MAQPHTTPGEHDAPVVPPGKPTPDDPRKETPIKDPPVNPDRDKVIYDENRVPG
jgi:hypothetical protein